jgi:hypothetical protein
MDVMGWSSSAMVKRYPHITAPVRMDIAERVGGLLWTPVLAKEPPNGLRAPAGCVASLEERRKRAASRNLLGFTVTLLARQ